ncbi:hypothetical protein JOQ06_025275 [Pogonophryne albipinna]|uniref:Uncharacterized protein n=1 Tax=Pogonophryne albipinna TaxID=1090488 RepID=A0AAD6AU16_9TELE|nr:hypothetical protein JOQ06_025275 [Pogonophryne albipinna]
MYMNAASLYSSPTSKDCWSLSQETRYRIPHRVAPCSQLLRKLPDSWGNGGFLAVIHRHVLTKDGNVLPAALPFGSTEMIPGELKSG